MKIFGIGTDIIKVKRLRKLINKKTSLFRLFHHNEVLRCNRTKNSLNCFAKRFAAKEAIGKAIGRGILNGTLLKYICIANDKNGKPFIKSIDRKIINEDEFVFFLSLSDEIEYAHASVIIARKGSVV